MTMLQSDGTAAAAPEGAAKDKVKLVKMDIDKHPSIPGQLGIQSIPAVFAFVNGQPVDGFLGALPESQVTAFIERLTKDRLGGEERDLLKSADDALASGDAAGAADLYAKVLAQDSGNLAALGVSEQAKAVGPISDLEQKVAANPLDHQARFDLALALNGKGRRQEAVDNLLEIVKRDRKWNDDGARKQLVQFFEAWGPTDEATVNGRKRLSSILFS